VDDSVGILATPNSPSSMAEAIVALYERDLEQMGAAARTRVLQRYTWDHAFHAQTVAYSSMVGSRRPAVLPREVIELRSLSDS
jgi:alpha-1,6-mannosyltransferase